jgi:hypothetical protein
MVIDKYFKKAEEVPSNDGFFINYYI